jgi:hypothetical protein
MDRRPGLSVEAQVAEFDPPAGDRRGALAEGAGVDDQVRCAQDIETRFGRAAVAAREVCVGDQG